MLAFMCCNKNKNEFKYIMIIKCKYLACQRNCRMCHFSHICHNFAIPAIGFTVVSTQDLTGDMNY